MDKNNTLRITASQELEGLRLDKALGQLSEIGSRSRAEYLIDSSLVTINGKIAKSSYKLRINDIISIELPPEKPTTLAPFELHLDILHEDQDIIVINKPAGLVVHPAAGHGDDTLVNALIHHAKDLSMKFGENRPGIVHRLDRDTSGVLVIAKNDFAHEHLAQQFKNRTSHRLYYAACIGVPLMPNGKIESFLARHPTDRKRYASLRDRQKKIVRDSKYQTDIGKWSVTNYKFLKRTDSGLSYLQLKLETGRTHQIRIHLSEMGCPIIADSTYGAGKKIGSIKNKIHQELIGQFPRFALHAAELGFEHPTTKAWMHFVVDWPEDLKPLLIKLGLI